MVRWYSLISKQRSRLGYPHRPPTSRQQPVQRGVQFRGPARRACASPPGCARTTTRLPGGSRYRRSRTRWRSRRRTRLRTTALPTALLTTKPARAGRVSPRSRAGPLRCAGERRGAGVRPCAPGAPRSRSPLAASAGSRRAARHGPVVGRSGRQTRAALAAAVGDHRTACAGPHPQPEAVGLRPAAVVRLVGALAHSGAPEVLVRSRTVARRLGCHRAPTRSSRAPVPAPRSRHARALPVVGRRQQPSTTRPRNGTRGLATVKPRAPRQLHTHACGHSLWTMT